MAATYTLQTAVIVPGYVTVQTLTPNEIVVGASITVAGWAVAYNGVKSVYAMPQFLPINVDTEGLIEYDYSYPLENAVMWAESETPMELQAITGTITFDQTCTWITGPQIATYLGITTAGDETAFLVQCAAAANAFCFRRRQESGYIDSSNTRGSETDCISRTFTEIKLPTMNVGTSIVYPNNGTTLVTNTKSCSKG